MLQFQDEKLRVIGFGSRTLGGAEMKYHTSKLEFLALKWTVCEHVEDYLFYVPHFEVDTDYNPLKYIRSTCRVNATVQKWIHELEDFNFTIHYKPGAESAAVDIPSWLFIREIKAYSQL